MTLTFKNFEGLLKTLTKYNKMTEYRKRTAHWKLVTQQPHLQSGCSLFYTPGAVSGNPGPSQSVPGNSSLPSINGDCFCATGLEVRCRPAVPPGNKAALLPGAPWEGHRYSPSLHRSSYHGHPLATLQGNGGYGENRGHLSNKPQKCNYTSTELLLTYT